MHAELEETNSWVTCNSTTAASRQAAIASAQEAANKVQAAADSAQATTSDAQAAVAYFLKSNKLR